MVLLLGEAQLEALQLAGAESHERKPTRTAHWNSTCDRTFVNRYGDLVLAKPQFREKPFEIQAFRWYALVEKALMNAIIESYLQGVWTRKIEASISNLGIDPPSYFSVSRIAQERHRKVHEFLTWPIEQIFPASFSMPSVTPSVTAHDMSQEALVVTAGAREDGYREILEAMIADSENEAFWSGLFFEDLKERGLTEVQLVIFEGHRGSRQL